MQRMRPMLAVTAPAGGFGVVLAALLLSAQVSLSAPPDAVVITAADAGKTVALVVGERLTVKLDAQSGTGFAWAPDATSTSLLALLGTTHGRAAMPGSAESQNLTFVARSAGEGNLKLAYRRPWEKDAAAGKGFSVAVRIGTKPRAQ
jgi:predicted secreted protein